MRFARSSRAAVTTVLAGMVLGLLTGAPAAAAPECDVSWTSTAAGPMDLSDPANWSGGSAPTADQDACFPSVGDPSEPQMPVQLTTGTLNAATISFERPSFVEGTAALSADELFIAPGQPMVAAGGSLAGIKQLSSGALNVYDAVTLPSTGTFTVAEGAHLVLAGTVTHTLYGDVRLLVEGGLVMYEADLDAGDPDGGARLEVPGTLSKDGVGTASIGLDTISVGSVSATGGRLNLPGQTLVYNEDGTTRPAYGPDGSLSGTWEAYDSSIGFTDTDAVTSIAGTVTLAGTGHIVGSDDPNLTPATDLGALSSIAATGSLTLLGADRSVESLNNEGTLQLQASDLSAGAYEQNGQGSVTRFLTGDASSLSALNGIDIYDGWVRGAGTLTGDVRHHGGGISPAGPFQLGGAPDAVLTIDGDYEQASDARLDLGTRIVLGNFFFDIVVPAKTLAVTDHASLGGVVQISTDPEYDWEWNEKIALIEAESMESAGVTVYGLAPDAVDGLTLMGRQRGSKFVVQAMDVSAPTAPQLLRSSHTVGEWSRDTTVTTRFDAGSEIGTGSGLKGVRYDWTQDSAGTPRSALDTPTTRSVTSPELETGRYFLNAQAKDNAGNVSDVLHAGAYKIDADPPSAARVTAPASDYLPRRDALAVSWSGSTDVGSGLKHYQVQSRSGAFTPGAEPTPWTTRRQTAEGREARIPLQPGARNCVRIVTEDNVGHVTRGGMSCVRAPFAVDQFARSDEWTALSGAGYAFGSAVRTSAKGATLTNAVRGSHIGVLAYTCPDCGEISLRWAGDEKPFGTIDLARATSSRSVKLMTPAQANRRDAKLIIRVISDDKPVTIDGVVVLHRQS